MINAELVKTAQKIAEKGKGILAADESSRTIKKRFDSINVESTEESRRTYRNLLFTTPNLSDYISGVILFEETLSQKTDDGVPFPEYLTSLGVLPGIKVDKGLVELANTDSEKVTQGLDGLAERLAEHKKTGVKFAKWRCVYNISNIKPSTAAIHANAEVLARYAAICQEQDIVPIVEPEVLIDGSHTLERCEEVTEQVLLAVFQALRIHNVAFDGMILKPSMVISGKACSTQAKPLTVAEVTVRVLKNTVPASVPTINFLSGGQNPEQATKHLDLMNKSGAMPWNLSFSYGRALQEPCLKTWQGNPDNIEDAQQAFQQRMRLNSAATTGEYDESMEKNETVLA